MDHASERVYDIFRELPEGTPVWVEAVKGLPQAMKRLQELSARSAGKYFVYDTHTQTRILRSASAGQ